MNNINKKQTSFNWGLLTSRPLLVVGAITLIGFFLRAYRVGFLTLWLDEYMHVSPAMNFLKGESMWQSDNNGIFLTWIMIGFFKLFGISETIARIPSVLFGTASIPLIYLLGKRITSKSSATIGALLYAISLYTICWSRLGRNYASFGFSFLLLLICLWLIFENKSSKKNFFERNGISLKYFILFFPAFAFSFLNHQLTFFILFSGAFYFVFITIERMIRGENRSIINIYSIIALLIIIGYSVFFSPLLDKIARPILSLLLSENIVNWVIPDWSFIIDQLKNPDTRYKSFNTYYAILSDDFSGLHYLGLTGFILAFFNKNNLRGAAFLLFMFWIPFLFMSFVFREPCTPNYLYYIYPLFTIAIGISITSIVSYITNRFASKLLPTKWFAPAVIMLTLLSIYSFTPKEEVKELITTEQHGQVVKKSLFHSTFVNWKEVCKQMRPLIKPEDAVMSTWPGATDFYLKRNNSIRFRQMHYDAKQKKYVPFESSGLENSAQSVEDLIKTIQNNKKGWFFADYYFENVMTDPRARNLVIQNFTHHFELGKDGEVQIFSWDYSKPITHRNAVVIELGKSERKQASKDLNFNVQTTNADMNMIIEAVGIDKPNEAFAVINNKYNVVFSVENNKINDLYVNDLERKTYTLKLNKEWFKEGQNSLKFAYNNKVKDFPKGFVIYNIRFMNI